MMSNSFRTLLKIFDTGVNFDNLNLKSAKMSKNIRSGYYQANYVQSSEDDMPNKYLCQLPQNLLFQVQFFNSFSKFSLF